MSAIFSTSDELAADWVRLRDENLALTAVVAAVHTALDQRSADWRSTADFTFVSAIAKALER